LGEPDAEHYGVSGSILEARSAPALQPGEAPTLAAWADGEFRGLMLKSRPGRPCVISCCDTTFALRTQTNGGRAFDGQLVVLKPALANKRCR
jgi:hypothetical protein